MVIVVKNEQNTSYQGKWNHLAMLAMAIPHK